MELITGLILLVAVYYAGMSSKGSSQNIKAQESLKIEQCTAACNEGTVSEFKWCKCKDNPMWEEK